MKSSLWVFGDSFSEDVLCLPDNDNSGRIKYVNKYLNGEYYKPWSYLLSQELNLEYKNRAAACGHRFTFMAKGNGNDSILANVAYNSNEFKKNDVVFVGLTDIGRFPWYVNDTCYVVLPNLYPDTDSNEFFDKILLQRNSPFYYEQIIYNLDLVYSLAKSIGFKLYVWSWNGMFEKFIIDNNIPREYFIYLNLDDKFNGINIHHYIREFGGTSISTETDDDIQDSHYSVNGEIAQYKLFSNILSKINHSKNLDI